MKVFALVLIACLYNIQALAAAPNVLVWSTDQKLEAAYDKIHNSLENSKFYVVFEPNIQANLSHFADKWGADYNRNGLRGIRAMVFCNGWYANQISNADPELLALCPLHITLIQQRDATRILFVRPSAVARGSPAEAIAQQLEESVAKAIDAALKIPD